ncbi:Monothiol glutaredoxin-S14 [Abeliophyllum distichum]|uniref:Monothiol glutaredoxin-S14 n=1 Tax=Abeliophyllum distichum TaxID=126358 RepID=A0ABD1SHL3_9LAMI
MLVAMAFSSQLVASPLSFSSRNYSQSVPKTVPVALLHRYYRPISFTKTNSNVAIASGRKISSIRCFSALTPELKITLDKVVTSQKVVLFMKGTNEFPQCGFSNTVVQILKSLNVPFETINILENETLRQGLKEYSNWPTFPQLYIDGEFFGGCDITVEAFKSGELQELLEKAMCS